ncbi:MAG: DUF5711 family protein [Catonella sp.]|nr:DUF5711 family protein [Catonella sp.]
MDERRSPRRLIITVMVIAIIAVTLIVIYNRFISKSDTYTGYSVTKRIERESTSDNRYIKNGAFLSTYNTEGITTYNNKGDVIWNAGVSLDNPRTVSAGDFFAAADIGGRKLYVIDESVDPATPVEIDTLADILEISIAKNGTVAVLLEEDAGYRIQLIDPSDGNNVIAEIATTVKDDGYAVGLALSPDGTRIVTSYFKDKSGTLTSSLTFYNFTSAGENSNADRIVGAFPIADTLFSDIEFIDNSTVVCTGDNLIECYSFSRSPAEKWKYNVNGKIKMTSMDPTGMAAVIEESDSEKLYVIDMASGKALVEEALDIDIIGLEYMNCVAAVHTDTAIRLLNRDGSILYEGSYDDGIQFMANAGKKNKYYIVSSAHIDVVTLQ